MTHWIRALLSAALLLASPGAALADTVPASDQAQRVAQLAPLPDEPHTTPPPAPDYQPSPAPAQSSWGRHGITPAGQRTHDGGISIGVPIWMTPKEGGIKPGIAFEGRYWLVFKYQRAVTVEAQCFRPVVCGQSGLDLEFAYEFL